MKMRDLVSDMKTVLTLLNDKGLTCQETVSYKLTGWQSSYSAAPRRCWTLLFCIREIPGPNYNPETAHVTEVCCALPQSFAENAEVLPWNGYGYVLPDVIQNHPVKLMKRHQNLNVVFGVRELSDSNFSPKTDYPETFHSFLQFS
jgi:hypothetical protein